MPRADSTALPFGRLRLRTASSCSMIRAAYPMSSSVLYPEIPVKNLRLAVAAFLAVSFLLPEVVVADPPPWAPAHGWRKKNDPNYVGYTGRKWDNDYGILDGRCDAAKVGTVLGGVAGGVIGSQVAKDSPNRPV